MYSFDIYDTLVTRKVVEPKGIFFVMAYVLQSDESFVSIPRWVAKDFAWMRILAEKQARDKIKHEINIEDIYTSMGENYGISVIHQKMLIELEKKCELDNTVIIPENIKRIIQLKEAGEKIVLVSDMYLDKSFFESLFEKICPLLNSFNLYVSCNIGYTKSSGKLYEYVKDTEHIDYCDWTHIGDNSVSDVSIPELLGIKAEYYGRKRNSLMDSRIDTIIGTRDNIIAQYLLGMQDSIQSYNREAAYQIGFSFVGIVLYSYVRWIIDQAVYRGIRHLYFIARDGYILKKIADIILKSDDVRISTHYLYGSRKAWRARTEDEKCILKEYLVQEFPDEGMDFALVDTQGTGKSIDNLSKIYGKKMIVFYYVLLESVGEKQIQPIVYSTYSGNEMIEVFCRAIHGSTEGYKRSEGKIEPILAKVSEDAIISSHLQEYIEGVEDFALQFTEINSKLKEKISLQGIDEKIIHYCTENPDIELASFIGDIPYDTNNVNEYNLYAPYLSDETIKNIEYIRTTDELRSEYSGSNLSYSYMRLPKEKLDLVNKYRKEYYKRKIEKEDGATKIVIYGFGKYGRELLHRAMGSGKVIVAGVVDANYERYKTEYFEISPLTYLMETEFDLVVISLNNNKMVDEIREILLLAGIPSSKILNRTDFLNSYLMSKS